MSQRNKQYSVKITETAWDMLVMHVRFPTNVSVLAANKLIDSFVVTTDNLFTMPERNPWLENDAILFQKYRKLLFGNYYLARYEIHGNVVYITAVVDCRQDFGWLL